MKHPLSELTLLFAVTALGAGCGGAPPPAQNQADAIAAVRSASDVGAANTPQAALHLELANQQMEQAAELMRQGRNDIAARVLMRARADAELAIALTREAQARTRAEETRQHIEDLQRGQL